MQDLERMVVVVVAVCLTRKGNKREYSEKMNHHQTEMMRRGDDYLGNLHMLLGLWAGDNVEEG